MWLGSMAQRLFSVILLLGLRLAFNAQSKMAPLRFSRASELSTRTRVLMEVVDSGLQSAGRHDYFVVTNRC